ncbi:MAG TPA: hypothetical protein VKA21_09650 [Candidatus Binatia bacterium]|nr:hypothetical protein [Candidatus Binatia bacterium]
MRLGPLLLALVLAACLAACGTSISNVNARPAKFYQHKVKFTGRIQRMQFLAHETLLELADTRGGRIIVRSPDPVDAETGDWVRVDGVLVPEVKVEDVLLYDVVVAESVDRARAPRFIELF